MSVNWRQHKTNRRAICQECSRCDLSSVVYAAWLGEQGGAGGYQIVEIGHDAILPKESDDIAVGSIGDADDLAALVDVIGHAKCAARQQTEILQRAALPEVGVIKTRRIAGPASDLATVVDVLTAAKISIETAEIQHNVGSRAWRPEDGMKFPGAGRRGTAEVQEASDLAWIVDAIRFATDRAGQKRQRHYLALVPDKGSLHIKVEAKGPAHHLASVVHAKRGSSRVGQEGAEIDGVAAVPQDRSLHDIADTVDIVGHAEDLLVVVEAEGEGARPAAEQR